MTISRFFYALALVVITIVAIAYGLAYLQIREHNRMAEELAQWELKEWKENLLTERQREFVGGIK